MKLHTNRHQNSKLGILSNKSVEQRFKKEIFVSSVQLWKYGKFYSLVGGVRFLCHKSVIRFFCKYFPIVSDITFHISSTHTQTVCDSVYKDDYYIQGVILGKNSHVFINDHVYEFDSQQFQTTNQIRILGKRGVHVEKFFEGVYLKGAKIFYVIMDVSSYQLYFVLTSDSEAMLEKVSCFVLL